MKIIEVEKGVYEFHECSQEITNAIRRGLIRYVSPAVFGDITFVVNNSVCIPEITADTIKAIPIVQKTLPPVQQVKWVINEKGPKLVTSADIKIVGSLGVEFHKGFEIIKLSAGQQFYVSGGVVKKKFASGTRVAVIVGSYKETSKKTKFHDKECNVIAMALKAKMFFTMTEAFKVLVDALIDRLKEIKGTYTAREIDELNSVVVIPNEDKTVSAMIVSDIECRDNGVSATFMRDNPNSTNITLRIYGTNEPRSYVDESIDYLVKWLSNTKIA